ncbi:MAG: hypothetical protein CR996_01345 [Draconibacterium sp.]|nr:MAG: hypothetical protein CR996_01345 [Draconibacterium sp.]PIF05555.1 MAG: hypothetical protein CSA36_06060 [Draconibacterium sp.]
MKKLLIIILIIIVVIAGLLIAAPVLFKPALLKVTRNTLNRQLNAKVNFDDINVSLLRHFPNSGIELKDLSIVGKGNFEQDTLVYMPLATAKMNIFSLLGEEKSISELVFKAPVMNLLVKKDGAVNWDIVKESTDNKTDSLEVANTFAMALEKIVVEDAKIVYDDREALVKLLFDKTNFDISGKMFGTTAKLKIDGKVDDFVLDYDSATYISHSTLETNTLLDMDYDKMIYSILENELFINRLPMEVTGDVKIPSDSVFFNLAFKTKESGFDNFLALVPPDYEKYLVDVKTNGTATVNGELSGYYATENYPVFKLHANVENASLQMADLPEKVSAIRAKIDINKPQGSLDFTTIKINDAYAQIKNNPVNLSLFLSNLFSNARFDGKLVGKINFNDLKDVIPLDSVNISGIVDANIQMKGNYEAVEKEAYDQIIADGTILLEQFIYDAADLTQKVQVPVGRFEFSPKAIALKKCDIQIGQSKFNLTGNLSDYLNYIFKDESLNGEIQLNSAFVNLNELSKLQKSVASDTVSADAFAAFDVPGNLNLVFRSKINNAIIDRLKVSDVYGLITVKNGILNLNDLSMNVFNGKMALNGSYQNTQQNRPLFNFGFNLSDIEIPSIYKNLGFFQKIAPIAAQSEGKFNSDFKLSGQLMPDFKVIATSLTGQGLLNTVGLEIKESEIFNQLKSILKPDKLRNVKVDDFKAAFSVENGNMKLKPFTTKIAGQETTILGELSARNLLNLKLDFVVERNAFGADIQNVLSAIPGNENITEVPATVVLEGPVGKPKVKIDLSKTKKAVTDATKDEIKKTLNKFKKGLQDIIK